MKELFELWMNNKHPYHYIIFGVINLFLSVVFIYSLVISFYYIWWWKLTLLSIGFFIVINFIRVAFLKLYFEEFKKGKL